MINRVYEVVQSYLYKHREPTFSDGKDFYIFKSFNINILRKFKYCWIVNEYEGFDFIREKKIGDKFRKVGLNFTLNFFANNNLDDFLKILTVTIDDPINLDVTKYHTKYSNKILKDFDIVIFVANHGRDLGAHKKTLSYLKSLSLDENMPVILSNSSFVPDIKIINLDFLSLISNRLPILIGASYSFGPKYYLLKRRHLQSFYLVGSLFNLSLIFSKVSFKNNCKDHVIRCGELYIEHVCRMIGIKYLVCYDGFIFNIWRPGQWSLKFYDHRLKCNN